MILEKFTLDEWNLFWNAFGAIGTTIGSFITAIAVFVAILQYRQPLIKVIKVRMNSAMSCDSKATHLYVISAVNRGMRKVLINSVFILGKSQKVLLNYAQQIRYSMQLPVELEPDRRLEVYFEEMQFKEIVKKAVDDKVLNPKGKLVVCVQDELGEEYTFNTKIKISEIIKDV